MSSRRGILLPIVAFLLLLVVSGSFLLNRAQRQRYVEAHRHTSGSIALQLAESGANAFFAASQRLDLPGGMMRSLFLESSYEDLEGFRDPIPLPALEALLEFYGDEAEVAVELEFENLRPLQLGESHRGVLQDPREKRGTLTLVSRASFRGVTRTLRISRAFQVVDPRVPVLSKFTLFQREQGDQPLDQLEYERIRPRDPMKANGLAARPVIFFHRPLVFPTVSEGLFHDLKSLFSDFAPDQGGLVFLGGDRPWNLPLVHGSGAGPYDELFHLRRTQYQRPASLPGFETEHWLWFGTYRGILDGPMFHPFADSPHDLRTPDGLELSDRSPPFHLFGDVGNVSPTVVLGNVFRSYVHLRLLDGRWFPYLEADEFSGVDPPGFGGDYQAYRQFMTRVVHDPYNRSFDYLVTNSETLDPDGTVHVDAETVPLVPPARLVPEGLTRLQPLEEGDRNFLYPDPENPGAPVLRLLRGGDGREVFRGSLEDLDAETLEALLAPRVIQRFPNPEAFWKKCLVKGKLELEGVTALDTSELVLENLAIGNAGTLVVSGSIQIRGWIRQTLERHPLTLVSLAGDIEVASPGPIHAHLVALSGTIRFKTDQIHVVGGLAARRIDWASAAKGTKVKWVTYDRSLDPTDPEMDRLGLFMDQNLGVEILGH